MGPKEEKTADRAEQTPTARQAEIGLSLSEGQFRSRQEDVRFLPVSEAEGNKVLDALDADARHNNAVAARSAGKIEEILERTERAGDLALFRSECLSIYRALQSSRASQLAVDQICEFKIAPELVYWVRTTANEPVWLEDPECSGPRFTESIRLPVQSVEALICALDPYLSRLSSETLKALREARAVRADDPRLFTLGQLLEARANLNTSLGSDDESMDLLRQLFPEAWGEKAAAGISPEFELDSQRIDAFRRQYEELPIKSRLPVVDAAEWAAKQFTAALADPARLHAALDFFHEMAAATQDLTGITVEARKDLPVFEIDALELKKPLRTIYQLRFSASPFACAEGTCLMLSEVMVRGADRELRRLNPDCKEERLVLLNVAGSYLEEYLHAIQSVKGRINFQGQDEWPSPDCIITSRLYREYLCCRGISPQRPLSSKREFEKLNEVDVLAKMIELYQDAGIPLARLKLECFEFHFDWRADFVDWALQKGILPSSLAPSWFFDPAEKEEKIEQKRRSGFKGGAD